MKQVNIDFFKSPGAAENAFRMAVCAIALAASLFTAGYAIKEIVTSPDLPEKLSKTSFMTDSISEPHAYDHREFFDSFVLGRGE